MLFASPLFFFVFGYNEYTKKAERKGQKPSSLRRFLVDDALAGREIKSLNQCAQIIV